MLSNRLNLAIFTAFAGMITCGLIWGGIGYEGIETLDDVFLGLSLVFAAILAGLIALVLGRFMFRARAESLNQ